MFLSRELATGRGPLGTHPYQQGTTQRSPFFCCCEQGWKKEGLFSLGEVARTRKTETWAPQISVDQWTNRIFISPKIRHCWGGGIPVRGRWVRHGRAWVRNSQSQWALAALHTWMDTEGLLHGAINISCINVSGFSRQTMHYFMVGKNQRKFKMRVELKLC